jgi:hypothetical protein
MGVAAMAAYLDGIARGTLTRRWNVSPFYFANGPKIHLGATISGTYPVESLLLPEQWSDAHVTEISGKARVAAPMTSDSSTFVFTLDAGAGYAAARSVSARSAGYGRALAALESFTYLTPGSRSMTLRVNAGAAPRAPLQRAIFASSADPFETFTNDYWRPRGALFKQFDMTMTPLGGARLRGFSPGIAFDAVASANVNLDQKLMTLAGEFGSLAIWGGVFADGGFASMLNMDPATGSHPFIDLGLGTRLRGKIYDREVDLRIDAPLATNDPLGSNAGFGRPKTFRLTFDWR